MDVLSRIVTILASSVTLAAALAVSGGACSPFGAEHGEEDETPATSGDASSTSDSGSDAGAPSDADVDGAVDAQALCTATFCEGFDDGTWRNRWLFMDQDTLATASDYHASPPLSLALSLPIPPSSSAYPRSWLKKDFPDAKHLKASVWMKILQMGNGSVDLFGIITQDQVNAKPVALVYDGSNFILEAPASGDAAPNQQATVNVSPIPRNDWTRIEIEVDLRSRAIGLRVNDVSTPPLSVTSQWEIGRLPLAVEVGASWTSADLEKPWIVHFDDVEVNVLP